MKNKNSLKIESFQSSSFFMKIYDAPQWSKKKKKKNLKKTLQKKTFTYHAPVLTDWIKISLRFVNKIAKYMKNSDIHRGITLKMVINDENMC